MDITILSSGSLELRIDENEREDIRDAQRERGEVAALIEASEPYWTNGSFQPFDASAGNPFVGLTSAPCIAESIQVDADGQQTIEGRLWWFPDYAVVGVVDELLTQGRVTFPAAPAVDNEPAPEETFAARRRRSLG